MLKNIRSQAKAAQSAKLHKLGGSSSLKQAKMGAAGAKGVKKYASGGMVSGAPVEGMAAKPRLDRPGRARSKSKGAGKKGTNVNVIIMQKPEGGDKPMPPMPMGPDAGPPMLPPGPPPGGPPMPMRKHGGRVNRADGGATPGEQMQAARKRRDEAETERNERGLSGFGSAGALAALAGTPGKIAKVLKIANAGFAGTSGLGAAVSQGKKMAAEAEMKRLGTGKAVEGEEDRKSGGRVGRSKAKC